MSVFATVIGVLRRHPAWLGAGVLALAVALRVAMFALGCRQVPAFDDECITVLQAKQIASGEISLFMLGQPYVFPLEAYLMAPWVQWLPRTAFGARVMAFGFGLLTLAFSLLALRRCGRWQEIWPGALLVLCGSAFLLILQAGCALPGYPTMMTLTALAAWLILRYATAPAAIPTIDACPPPAASGPQRICGLRRAEIRSALFRFTRVAGSTDPAPRWGWAAGAGLAAGLACSESFLVLPVLLAGGVVALARRPWPLALKGLAAYGVGAAIGLMPYFLGVWFHPEAAQHVLGSVTVKEAVGRLVGFAPATLAGMMGLGVPVYPGSGTRLMHHPELAPVLGWGVLAVVLAATALGVVQAWRARGRAIPPVLFFAAVAWGCLALFLMGERAHARTYRYLMPLALSVPFLVACLYRAAGPRWRAVLATLVAAWVVFNGVSTVQILRYWARAEFPRELGSHDLEPVVATLSERGIRHAYASYADAYRITFMTDGAIVCAQPYNERFPGWPVPFKAEVDAATNVAYVLMQGGRFPPERLDRHLKAMGVTATRVPLGRYVVYTGFENGEQTRTSKDPACLRPEVSHAPAKVGHLTDGTERYWRCEGFLQTTGMWVAVTWEDPHRVTGVTVNYGGSPNDHPETVNVHARDEAGAWVPVAAGLNASPDPFVFVNGHPVYGAATVTLTLPAPVVARGVKLEIARPRKGRAWTIAELGVLGERQ